MLPWDGSSSFPALWGLEAPGGRDPKHDALDLNHLGSNDVNAILNAYGVEAARAAIMKEVQGVFGVYHNR